MTSGSVPDISEQGLSSRVPLTPPAAGRYDDPTAYCIGDDLIVATPSSARPSSKKWQVATTGCDAMRPCYGNWNPLYGSAEHAGWHSHHVAVRQWVRHKWQRRIPVGLARVMAEGAGRAVGLIRSASGARAHVANRATGAFQCLVSVSTGRVIRSVSWEAGERTEVCMALCIRRDWRSISTSTDERHAAAHAPQRNRADELLRAMGCTMGTCRQRPFPTWRLERRTA